MRTPGQGSRASKANSARTDMRAIYWLGLGLIWATLGCGRHDIKDSADQYLEGGLMASTEKQQAIPFFEGKGHYYDTDTTTNVDREIVLPLLKRLNELAPTEQWALHEKTKSDTAVAVVVGLPKNAQLVDRMAEAVQEADAKFPGFIVQQWGNQWLLFSLIDEETHAYFLSQNPNFDKQR
jgi:hypothetical protein